MPPRLIGLYALATMDRDGPIHGYRLSERIAERTDGAWRPGPGAVYPALRALVDRGFASCRGSGRRREYRITAAGRRALRAFRLRARRSRRGGPDLSALWAETVGAKDVGAFLLRRLDRNLASIAAYLGRKPPRSDATAVRTAALAAVRRASGQFRARAPRRTRAAAAARR